MSGDVAVRACHAYGTGSTAARARIIPQLAAPLPVIWTPRIRWSAARSIKQFLPKLALRWFHSAAGGQRCGRARCIARRQTRILRWLSRRGLNTLVVIHAVVAITAACRALCFRSKTQVLPLIRELQGMVDSPTCRSDTQTVDCHIWSACMHRAPCRASTTGCYRKLADSTSNSEEIGGTRHIQCTLSPGQSGLVLLLRISQCAQADQRWPRPEPRATAGRHCACLFAGTR
jgi:hypothetical protein